MAFYISTNDTFKYWIVIYLRLLILKFTILIRHTNSFFNKI